MTKFIAPKLPANKTRVRTSFRLPEALLDKIHESMSAGGYSLKQRSLWLNEAIAALAKKEFALLVLEDFLYPGKNEKIPLTLTEKSAGCVQQIEQHIQQSEGETPAIGAILRTATLQRIMSENTANKAVPSRDNTL